MRNPFKRRPDQYPAIKAIGQEWFDKAQVAGKRGDMEEHSACMAAWKRTNDWIVYATCGKERFNPEIVDYCRKACGEVYRMERVFRAAEKERAEIDVRDSFGKSVED